MGRPRTFDTDEVVASAAAAFRRLGYEGTSVDDLVAATGLHRGSLYGAFGSKRGLFVTALRAVVTAQIPAALAGDGREDGDVVTGEVLDLVLVAALELAPRDAEARELVARAGSLLDGHRPERGGAAALLGERLLHRAAGPAPGASPDPVPPGAPPAGAPPSPSTAPTTTTREAAP